MPGRPCCGLVAALTATPATCITCGGGVGLILRPVALSPGAWCSAVCCEAERPLTTSLYACGRGPERDSAGGGAGCSARPRLYSGNLQEIGVRCVVSAAERERTLLRRRRDEVCPMEQVPLAAAADLQRAASNSSAPWHWAAAAATNVLTSSLYIPSLFSNLHVRCKVKE